ncbi:MAG: hypothetical protein ACLQCU_16845 [Acidimicrobiales bacterium]
MTVLAPVPVLPRAHKHPVPWRPMARETWLQHRGGGLIGVLVLFSTCALAIVVERLTAPSYARSLGIGSVNNPSFTFLVHAVQLFPLVIGVFVGAPLISRELESGTFRFTWTQEVGRTRFVITTLVVLAGFTVASACGLAALLGWCAHAFEVVGIQSQWQPGLFDVTPVTLAGWALFALVLGTFLGAVIGRSVAAMAATAFSVGGLVVASNLDLVRRLLATAPLVTSRIPPVSMAIGTLNSTSYAGGELSGGWLVRGWVTGTGGRELNGLAAYQAMDHVQSAAAHGVTDPTRWLSLHHYALWMSYQPASRFWIFQVIAAAILVLLAALLALATVRLVRRRA